MNDPQLKITFSDKEDSWILNQNSKYVLTAANINEIKTVVNNISNYISGLNMFSDIYKYARFVVPNTLKSLCKYELQIEIATKEDFSDKIVLTSTDNTKLFNIFNQNIWQNLTEIEIENENEKTSFKTSFDSDDSNKSVYVEIKDYIKKSDSYFGRYRWKNLTTFTYTDYFGFILGAFDYSDVNDKQNEIVSFFVVGDESAFEKTTHSYQLKCKKENGIIIDFTPSANFTSSNLSTVISGSTIKFAKTHTEHVESIKAEIEYDNEKHYSYLDVVVHPVKLESLELLNSNSFSKMQSNISKQIDVRAKYSNGSAINVTDNCSITSTFSYQYDANHNFSISGNEEELGALEISYSDSDYPEEEKATLTKYIKLQPDDITSLTTNIPETINFSNKNSSYNVNYKITGTKRFSGTVDLTSTSIISVVNGNGITFSNGTMTINPENLKNGQNISLLISNPQTSFKLEKSITVIGDSLNDLDIEISGMTSGFETFENTSDIPFKIKAKIGETQTELTSGYEFRCVSSNKITIENNKINVGRFDANEYVTFVATYSLHGKTIQKYATILVKSNPISTISVSGNFNSEEGAIEEYRITATYMNGSTADITNSSKITLAYGNPENVAISNNNPITIEFNSINSANVTMAFIAEESQSGKTKAFTVNVVKN